jgi:hypothetical protein
MITSTIKKLERQVVYYVSNIDNCVFHLRDIFATIMFVDEHYIYSDIQTDCIILEFENMLSKDEQFDISFENGHRALSNKIPAEPHPFTQFSFINNAGARFMIDWSNSGFFESNIPDFSYNNIDFVYGEYKPLTYEGRLYFDMTEEFPKIAYENEFTFIVKVEVTNIESIRVYLFSDTSIIYTPSSNGTHLFKVLVTQQVDEMELFCYEDSMLLNTVKLEMKNTYIELVCTRTQPFQSITVKNVMLFQGILEDDSTIELTGTHNICIGSRAGYMNNNGSNNIYLGKDTGSNNLNGLHNIAIGMQAAEYAVSATNNVSIGKTSGQYNVSGKNNICIGDQSGQNNKTGSNNVLLGFKSGAENQGNDNICIGGSQVVGDGNIIIGNNINGIQDNELRIGELITGDLLNRILNINGKVSILDTVSFKLLNIRVLINSIYTIIELRDVFEHITFESSLERVDLIQRIEEDHVHVFDFKISKNDVFKIKWRDEELFFTSSESSTRESFSLLIANGTIVNIS